VPAGHVEHERPERDAPGCLGEKRPAWSSTRARPPDRRRVPQVIQVHSPSKPASSAATAAARMSAQRAPMGIRRRSVFTAGSIARRELVDQARLLRRPSKSSTSSQSDDERAVDKETGTRWTPHLRGDCSTHARTL